MELHEKLLHFRKARGMTQDEFAEALFVSRQTVYKWETGRALPDVNRLRQICDFYQISADELLDTQFCMSTAEVKSKAETAEPDAASTAAGKRKIPHWVMIAAAAAVMLCAALLLLMKPQEVRSAKTLGIVPEGMDCRLNSSITERELLTLLANTARMRLGQNSPTQNSPTLTAALKNATNEQMTREKAAYWLYCAHVWTVCDPHADMAIEHRLPCDPVTQRNVYEDLNNISRARADATSELPWERGLCRELRETEELFAAYDGSPEMDRQINAILFGPYYTAVSFCLGQRSYINGKPILDTADFSFRPKENITRKAAIIAAYRLYGAW